MKTGSYFKRVIKVKSVTCIVQDEMQKSVAHFYQPSKFLLNFSINGIESFFRSLKAIALNFSMKWKKIAISFSTPSPDPDPNQVLTEITIRKTKWIREHTSTTRSACITEYRWKETKKKCGKPNMKKTQKTKNKDEKKTWVLNVIKTNR